MAVSSCEREGQLGRGSKKVEEEIVEEKLAKKGKRTSFARTGFARYPSIPLSKHRSLSPAIAEAVRAMIRRLRIRGSECLRMAAVAA
jgi:hypothetical protein